MGERVTNKQLADLIGGMDDQLVVLGKDVAGIKVSVRGLEAAAEKANGIQRADHDKVLALAEVQKICPARLAHDKGDDNSDSGWSLAKWGLKQYGVFGFQAVVILGLFALLLHARGLI